VYVAQPEYTHTHTAVLQPFVWDYPGGPVPEQTFRKLQDVRY